MELLKTMPGNWDFHSAWDGFLEENEQSIYNVIRYLMSQENYTPGIENIFRFMRNDLESAKIVIIGQDPYPEEGRATGRAFEVLGLEDWQEPFRQVSLKNIVRLLYYNYQAASRSSVYQIPFNQIRGEISSGAFKIKCPPKLFQSWESQGVILLNRYLTCQIGNPGSHRKLWKPLTDNIIRYIRKVNPYMSWFLWGTDAKAIEPMLCGERNVAVYSCRHPMLCSEKYEDDFLKSKCFKDTMDRVFWL